MTVLTGPDSPAHDDTAADAAGTTVLFYRPTFARLYETADAAFATPTPRLDVSREADRTRAVTTADPEAVAATADAPVLHAVEQLHGWLNVPYDVVASIAGFRSPSLIHHWRRQHREGKAVRQRASSVERLLRVHATLRAIAEALDGNVPGHGVQLWARDGRDGVSPLDLLLGGDLSAFEEAARRLLVDGSSSDVRTWRRATAEEEREFEAPVVASSPEYGESDFG